MREYQRGRSRWRCFRVRLQDVGIVAIRHDVESSGDIRPIPLGELSMQFRGIQNNRVGSVNDLRFKPAVSAGAACSSPWRPRPRISEVRDPVNIANRPQGISNQMAGERRRGQQYHINLVPPDDAKSPHHCMSEPADLVIWKAEETGRGATTPRLPTRFVNLCLPSAYAEIAGFASE